MLIDELTQNVGVPVGVQNAFQDDVVAEVEGVSGDGSDEAGRDRVGSAGVVLAEQDAPQVVLLDQRAPPAIAAANFAGVVVFPLPELPRITTSIGSVMGSFPRRSSGGG